MTIAAVPALKIPAAWKGLLADRVVQEVKRIHDAYEIPMINEGRYEFPYNLLEPRDRAYIRALLDVLKKLIIEHFGGDPTQHHPDHAVISTLKGGGIHPYHADNEKYEGVAWVPNHTPQRTYSGILYLSTPIAGGEIHFPQHRIFYKPEPGLIVGFPSTRDYVHGVRAVTAGERHALVFWFSDQEAFRLRG